MASLPQKVDLRRLKGENTLDILRRFIRENPCSSVAKKRPWHALCLRGFAASRETSSLQSPRAAQPQQNRSRAKSPSYPHSCPFMSIRGSNPAPAIIRENPCQSVAEKNVRGTVPAFAASRDTSGLKIATPTDSRPRLADSRQPTNHLPPDRRKLAHLLSQCDFCRQTFHRTGSVKSIQSRNLPQHVLGILRHRNRATMT